IDQADAIADLPAIAVLQLSNQRREQAGKYFHRARSIRTRQCRLGNRATAKMIKLASVALQAGFNLAKPARPAQLSVQHCNQVRPALYRPIVPIGIVPVHKPIKCRPRNLLQKAVKNDILVRHDVDPFAVQMIRNHLNPSRINVVHFLKQKSCRTPVGLSRPSTSFSRQRSKTWMPGTSPGMTTSSMLIPRQLIARIRVLTLSA